MVVDASSGNVIETMSYDEFGNETEALAPNKPAGYVPLPFGFAGGLYDPDTTLVRFGARDYDASVGRWTAKDPSLFDGGHNLYEYAWSDPTNYIDQTGTYCFFVTIGIGAAEGAAWGAGIELLSQELSGRACIDWGAVGKAALGGAVQGAVMGSFGLLGGAWCFSPGTLVATCDGGPQPIETLREHDRVLSQNEDGTVGCHEVSRTFERVADDRVDVVVGSGEAQEALRTTLGHRFWVERRGWVAAKDLQTDDVALDMGGVEQPITRVSTEPGLGRVYNLEVEGAHTYFVGATKVLVHNGCDDTSKILNFTERDLVKGFMKHGDAFGLQGNWNPLRSADYSRAVNQFINDPAVVEMSGTYRAVPVTHFFNPATGVNVIATPGGKYISAWTLSTDQLQNLILRGSL
jgi:RHS repeat-associated protein